MKSTLSVCSLFEGHYDLGAAALINSLVSNGFSGRIWFGIRGDPPAWARQFEINPAGGFQAGGVALHFITLSTPDFLASTKADFMLSILRDRDPGCEGIVYFDPDIVVDAPWSFFEDWASRGVALCEDSCFGSMSENHLLRVKWRDFAEKVVGQQVVNLPNRSYNSGFAAVMRPQLSFLEDWSHATACLPKIGVALSSFKPGTRRDAFFGTDQDTMNVACMVNRQPIIALGQEGMGFSAGMNVMWHAVDNPKPWCRNYLLHLLRFGQGVPQSHRHYWRFANGLISPWSRSQYFLRCLNMKLATLVSRLYHSAS